MSCPPGWMAKAGGIGGFYKGRSFREPSGKVHPGVLDALRSLARTDRKEEMAVLRENLELDGWISKDSLPIGWMTKGKVDSKGKTRPLYLTSNYERGSSVGEMIAIMKRSPSLYSEEDITQFKSKNGLNWLAEPGLPEGWTLALVNTSQNGIASTRKKYMSPNGKFWNSDTQVLKDLF